MSSQFTIPNSGGLALDSSAAPTPLTPYSSFELIREAIAQYLETAYKVGHPTNFRERSHLLRLPNVIVKEPFIESTPKFPTASKLRELEAANRDKFPAGLGDLIQFGVDVDGRNLYTHQQEAILQSVGDNPNLLIGTGTGSGKTEAFLLPALIDILNDAMKWPEVSEGYFQEFYSTAKGKWLSSRSNENRKAATKAFILYQMNALVNDQMSRLRRILSTPQSMEWQQQNLNGNRISFAMYTSLTSPTGHWRDPMCREHWAEAEQNYKEQWDLLNDELRRTGSWPSPNSSEMLCRWDVHATPPDILVTNNSMLEYMLARPIEAHIFESTREWLKEDQDNRVTLVLDEAHTYSGARGTEVAYLIRRLKERLGLGADSGQFRVIATTASFPEGADDQVTRFISNLSGESSDRFSIIRSAPTPRPKPLTDATLEDLHAFERFYEEFQSGGDSTTGLANLIAYETKTEAQAITHPHSQLFQALEHNRYVTWVRGQTARNATSFLDVSRELWGEVGQTVDDEVRNRATAGILAAGRFARPTEDKEMAPLLSSRVHAFFRGIPGIWACMNPNCSELIHSEEEETEETERPFGKIYAEPRVWCDCGGRVLEVFSCRRCGLLHLGGIPDGETDSLWPWTDDLESFGQKYANYKVFGVEAPNRFVPADHRS